MTTSSSFLPFALSGFPWQLSRLNTVVQRESYDDHTSFPSHRVVMSAFLLPLCSWCFSWKGWGKNRLLALFWLSVIWVYLESCEAVSIADSIVMFSQIDSLCDYSAFVVPYQRQDARNRVKLDLKDAKKKINCLHKWKHCVKILVYTLTYSYRLINCQEVLSNLNCKSASPSFVINFSLFHRGNKPTVYFIRYKLY